MTRAPSPGRGSRSEWCTIRREPPGPPARLWQTFLREDSAKPDLTPGHSSGRRSRRPSPPCQRDACSGNRRRTRRRKEPHTFLRQVASGASSETNFSLPGGSDPDRGRSLGFLTSTDHPHPEVPDRVGPRRARPPRSPHAEVPGTARPRRTRPQVDQSGRMLRGPRFTRAPQHEGAKMQARFSPLPLVGEVAKSMN